MKNLDFNATIKQADDIIAVGSFSTKVAQKEALALLGRQYERELSEDLRLAARGRDGYSSFDIPLYLHEFGKKAKALFSQYVDIIAKIELLQARRATIKALPIVKAPSRKVDINPNKDVKTCPCCFRSIAVQDNKMVHHGYQRTGMGFQTNSCLGIKYAPLEVSDAGMHAMVTFLTERLESNADEIRALHNATTFNVLPRAQANKPHPEAITLHKGTKAFTFEFQNRSRQLESTTRYLNDRISLFERGIALYKQDPKLVLKPFWQK